MGTGNTNMQHQRPGFLNRYFGRLARSLYWSLTVHKIAPYSFADDKAFIQYKFHQKFGFPLNLKNPQSFNEKLNWMKLYDRNPLYTQLVDKLRVRDYVEAKIGPQYLNKLLGVYEKVEDIDWEGLPQRFVLKINHGCKFNIICRDKSQLDIPLSVQKLTLWMKDNGYIHAREWPYKNVPPRIICEEYLEGDPVWGLLDYKFFCFNGKPVYIAVDFDRFTYHTQFFYDLEWRRQPFVQGLPTPNRDAPRPDNLDEMIQVAKNLSSGFPFLRVDLYDFDRKVLFGELTLHPAGSFKKITPEKYEWMLGELVEIP